ncbi:hypothetical protein CEXT_371141 [Caerostris extrusa]|uniref:Uncharacterized protein n=1 Tax=Caerostris extrusa TaxID=172846 RepID=A0AAV4XQU8_CAEEX|nr:hypothetical protein CEXT_371141 [Caerostris extrusa]
MEGKKATIPNGTLRVLFMVMGCRYCYTSKLSLLWGVARLMYRMCLCCHAKIRCFLIIRSTFGVGFSCRVVNFTVSNAVDAFCYRV